MTQCAKSLNPHNIQIFQGCLSIFSFLFGKEELLEQMTSILLEQYAGLGDEKKMKEYKKCCHDEVFDAIQGWQKSTKDLESLTVMMKNCFEQLQESVLLISQVKLRIFVENPTPS
jgi:uncharacterized Fe-S cluster-containing MiaB family protein